MLDGKLVSIRPPGEARSKSVAVISITGRLQLLNSLALVNAELEFAFRDPSPADRGRGAVRRP